jgi:predicted lipoprotein with Yx(FWY)xxD motif
VTYADHPLYYFAGDETTGAATGQGALSLWFTVSPAGTPIE